MNQSPSMKKDLLFWTAVFYMCSLLPTTSSFSVNNNFNLAQQISLPSSTKLNMNMDRRTTLSKISSATLFGILSSAYTPTPAHAKSKEPVTKESMAKAFADIKYELNDPDGGIPKLQLAIEKANWEDVKGFTKFYDLEFRKAKMVKARKMFPDSDMKTETLTLTNNVTFDLIGINRASRAEDQNEAFKYLEELKGDITAFLAYEDKVVIP